MKDFIGMDIGGTLLRIAKVNPKTGQFETSPKSINLETILKNRDLTEIIIGEIKELSPKKNVKGIGICAAGDVDEKELVINYSPNSKIKGKITFPRSLKNAGYDVALTNDMKAAVQDSARFGEGKNYENVCTATYSEGHNAALARNGKNVTKAEMGHNCYKPEGDLFCGCGQRGHLEPYVSGKGAETMARQYFHVTNETNHPILESVGKRLQNIKNPKILIQHIWAKDVYDAYRKSPSQNPQKGILETQAEAISASFGLIVSMWNPVDIIVCMGGQTKDEDILFNGEKGAIHRYYLNSEKLQLRSLKTPKILVTKREEIGVRGAVAYYMNTRL